MDLERKINSFISGIFILQMWTLRYDDLLKAVAARKWWI